ncbi:MAG: twin-arginine translocase TatA/TatE family subunit [Crocinitomicaceae bacterium]|nr:twin-arginine translocase TatA/TatE family subunit [Crocinitomicaceae bacterium]
MTILFLNSLGTGEVILILFVVLLLFGSKGIPDVVKNLGRGMSEIRNASNEIKRDIQKSALEMRKDLQIENPLDDITKDIKKMDDPESTISLDTTPKEKQNIEDSPNTDQKDKSA